MLNYETEPLKVWGELFLEADTDLGSLVPKQISLLFLEEAHHSPDVQEPWKT